MSLLDDASLLSFYFISQSSQKIPPQEGIEDSKNSMSQSKKRNGKPLETEYMPVNLDYCVKTEENPRVQNEYL